MSVFLRAQNRAFRCFPSCKKPCSRSCFLVLSLVHKIVLFGALPRAKNRALYRAFWCSPSCQKSCFLVLSFVHCSPLSKHRALDRVFWCSPSCTKSWFLLLSLVRKIVLFPQTVYCRGSQFFLKRCPPLCYWPCPPLWASRFICLPSFMSPFMCPSEWCPAFWVSRFICLPSFVSIHVSFGVVVSVAASIPGSSTGTWTVLECI